MAVGPIALDAQAATSMSAKNQSPILMRTDISLDGHSGSVYPGKLDVVVETPTANLETVHCWQRPDATQTTEIYS